MNSLSPGNHHLTVHGTRQAYHVAGQGPVMIAHSGGPGVDSGYLGLPRLEEHFTMVVIDPVGTGASGPLPADATFVDTYADFLTALIDHLGVPRVHLLGHSHGGHVVQRYAVDHPDRVAGLVLYSTSPTTGTDFWESAVEHANAYPQRHPGIPEVAEVMRAFADEDPLTDGTDRLRGYLPLYFSDFWGPRRAEYEEIRSHVRIWPVDFDDNLFDIRAELPSISAPTLIITGRDDFICGPVWAEMLRQGIPGSRLVILPDCGHFAQIEQPDAFFGEIVALLDRVPTAS